MGLILMDESGDTGLRGGSQVFVLGAVAFWDVQVAQQCQEAIAELRVQLGLKQDYEFHFSRCRRDRVERFLHTVVEYPFRYCICQITKAKLQGKAWQKSLYMYEQAAYRALKGLLPEISNAKLIFDRKSQSKSFERAFLDSVRRHAGYREGVPVICETQSMKSHTLDLLQMADMVIGAAISGKDCFRGIVKKREGSYEMFP